MKKKLLITASTFPRWEGDTEPRFILDYAKAMQTYFDVTVLAPSAPGTLYFETLEGVPVIRYRYFPIKKWETLCYPGAIVPRIKEKKIRAVLVPFLLGGLYIKLLHIHKNFDIVHAHWLIPQGIVQSFIKTPYLVTGHGGDVTSLNKGFMKSLKGHCIKNAIFITAVSRPFAEVIETLWPNDKTSVISMGCNTSNFSPKYRKQDYFNQKEKKVVLFVGRLVEKKGVTYLIEAMESIDAHLVIVGSGPLENELKKQASKLPDRISFLGAKTHFELKTIYASADIFAAPSVTALDGDKEGFGLVILEAMASGLPVVASRSGGIIDIVKHNHNGLLADERDVVQLSKNIQLLISDDTAYERMRENALDCVQKYDYSSIAKEYSTLINNYFVT